CPSPCGRARVAPTRAPAAAGEAAFRREPEPLAIDGLVLGLTEALLDADPSCRQEPTSAPLDERALSRARAFLDAETSRVIRSSELEAITGLTRYDLARQFRRAYGTSPYRYSLLRRLDCARTQLHDHERPAEVALATGFADQAHLTRKFKSAFGLTPSPYQAITRPQR